MLYLHHCKLDNAKVNAFVNAHDLEAATPTHENSRRVGHCADLRQAGRSRASRSRVKSRESPALRKHRNECIFTVKSQKARFSVIPAKAGIQENQGLLDPGLRRGDGTGGLFTVKIPHWPPFFKEGTSSYPSSSPFLKGGSRGISMGVGDHRLDHEHLRNRQKGQAWQ